MPKCKICKSKFTASSSLKPTCDNYDCKVAYALKVAEKNKAARERKEKKDHREWKTKTKEKLMTLSDYIQICQKVFNTYIRMRDKDKPCISSGRPLKGKYDAGHYYSTGAYPNLRFYEDNVHGQSVHDNRDLHGNLIAYREGLIKRIGMERFEALEALKQVPRHYTIPEVKELIKTYRNKIKELQ
jgi:hypothetical protein